MQRDSAEQPVFYYDLGDPWCYLAAEQVTSALPVFPEWEPVLGADVVRPAPAPERRMEAKAAERRMIEAKAAQLGLQPLRWPPRPDPDTRQAMLAATYAKRIGRAVAFSLAAFRQAFAGGRDLADEDTVLIAAAAAEMHPAALLKGIALRSVQKALHAAGERARRAGVASLPAIGVGDLVLEGVDLIEEAVRALGAPR